MNAKRECINLSGHRCRLWQKLLAFPQSPFSCLSGHIAAQWKTIFLSFFFFFLQWGICFDQVWGQWSMIGHSVCIRMFPSKEIGILSPSPFPLSSGWEVEGLARAGASILEENWGLRMAEQQIEEAIVSPLYCLPRLFMQELNFYCFDTLSLEISLL